MLRRHITGCAVIDHPVGAAALEDRVKATEVVVECRLTAQEERANSKPSELSAGSARKQEESRLKAVENGIVKSKQINE